MNPMNDIQSEQRSSARFTTHLALNRFAMGARPGQAASTGSTQDWLLAQLSPQPLPKALAALPGTVDVLLEFPKLFGGAKNTASGNSTG
ncbi:MAG: hypothetical protein HEQ39_12235 [Rhizobacter sp.]